MEIRRAWAMPSSETFGIPPIREIVTRYAAKADVSVDPYARNSHIASHTNDLNPDTTADSHMDAIEFMGTFADSSVDLVLFDPPYSPRQVSECYKALNIETNMQTTQASYWANAKDEIARIVKVGGYVITCGWNSGGIGQRHGFQIDEILLVAHGGWHNDTIVTVERKTAEQQKLFNMVY